MIRSKGEAGTGNIIEAVSHMRAINNAIKRLTTLSREELMATSRDLAAPLHLVEFVSTNGRLPVVNFAAGGIATPADAALMMQLGAEGVFVGSGVFKSTNPEKRARAIVLAVTHYNDPVTLLEISKNLGEAMVGINLDLLDKTERLAERGC